MANHPMAEALLFLMGMYMVLSLLSNANLFEERHIKGRVVLLTDSTSQLGSSIALEYARLHAKLFLVGPDPEQLRNLTVQLLKSGADEVSTFVGDVRRRQHLLSAVQSAERRFGQLHHLLINHQLQFPVQVSVWNDTHTLRQALDDYVFSTVEMASAALPLLRANRGHLGVVSGISGKISLPHLSAVTASAAALNAYLAALRQELKLDGQGFVSVTNVALGYVDGLGTELEQGRWAGVFSRYGQVDSEHAAWHVTRLVGGRKKEVTYPFAAQCHSFLHNWLPSLLHNSFSILSILPINSH